MQKLESIQFLRAVAAVAVVIVHLGPTMPSVAAAGVDVFFVISGFVMGAFAMRSTPGQFLFHRVVRVVPLYWGMTIFMCLASLAGVFSNFSFTPDALWKSLLFVPYIDPNGLLAPLVVVGWTLNLEMFFYAVFAVGLALSAPMAVTASILIAMAVAGQVVNWQWPVMQAWTSVLLIEFLSGLVLSQIMFANRMGGALAVVLGVAGFAVAGFIEAPEGLLRLGVWGVPSFLLVMGCVWLEKTNAWSSNALKPFGILGDASYALYLTHGLVISLVHKFLQPGLVFDLVSLALAVAVAISVHVVIERPMLKGMKRIWPSTKSAHPATTVVHRT